MNKRDAWVFAGSAVVFGLILCLVVGVANAKTPFGYRYLGTVGWVPGDGYVAGAGWVDGNFNVLPLGVAFGRVPELVTVSSPADFRLFPMATTYMANTELMSTGASAAQIDSLMAAAQAIPAVGKVFYGSIPWFIAHDTSDTLWIDGYAEE